MAKSLRDHDWSKSILGAPSTWPRTLQSAVRIMLSSGQPTAIWWGSKSVCLFNDVHYLAIGEHGMHDSVGSPARDHWAAVWSSLRSQAAPGTRRAEQQDTYWKYSSSAIENGGPHTGAGAVSLMATESTERVLAEELLIEQIKSQQQHFLASPSFIVILRGPTHIFDFVNSASRRLLGARDFIGKALLDVLPELREHEYPAILDRVYLSGKRYVSPQCSVMLQRGPARALNERTLNLVCEPIIDKDGATTGIFVEGLDVAELMGSDAHRRSSERWTPLFASN